MKETLFGEYCGCRKQSRVLALLLVFISPAIAQPSAGSIRGTVLDETGAAIPGAQVTAIGPRQNGRIVSSQPDGKYFLGGLAPGDYILQVNFPGFLQRDRVRLAINGNKASVNISMRLSVFSEPVTVHEDLTPVVTTDPESNASAISVTERSLRALSDDPDDLESDIRALAGPSAGLNAANIYIDGVQAGDAVLPGKAAISEVRINQNPFAPEFDEMGLGRIELITKSAADKYKGEIHFNYGNDIFNSRSPYAAEKPPFDLKQFGGSLGGPINRRTSFFLDVDRRNVGNGAVINAAILDPATLAVVNPYTQTFVSPFVRTRLGPRLDVQLGPRHSLTVRYGLTQNDNHDSGVGEFNLVTQGADIHLREHALQISETSTLGANIVNQTQFQFLHQYQTHQATTPEPTIEVFNAFTGGGDRGTFTSYIHHHYQVQNNTTIAAHAHTLKFGVRLRAISILSVSQENFLGTFTFGGAYAPILGSDNRPVVPGTLCNSNLSAMSGCTTITSIEQYRRTLVFQQLGYSPAQIRALGGGASQFSLNAGIPLERVGGVDAGLFAGDDWRVRPNLTLSFGLRFETQTNISDHADFAPRVGFAWSPGGGAKNASPAVVIRGGFGIFYQRFLELDLIVAQRFNGIDQKQYLYSNPDFFPYDGRPLLSQDEVVNLLSSTMRAPYLLQSMLSVERQFTRRTTMALTYVNSHGVHQFRGRDLNAPLPGTYQGSPGTGTLPYPNRGPIYEMESDGLFNQNQVILNVNTQARKNLSLFGSYTLNYARSNTDGLNTLPANQYDMTGEYGPAFNDIRHRVSLGGSIVSLWKLEFNPLIIIQSGSPFDVTTSQDIYGTGVLRARPGFATDANKPGVIATSYGFLDPNPTPGETIVPRNYGRGPGQFAVNLRLGRTFTFGENGKTIGAGQWDLRRLANWKFTLTPAVSVRNLLNHVNPGPVIGDINSPLFGKSNQLASGIGAFDNSANNRRLEFQMQLGF